MTPGSKKPPQSSPENTGAPTPSVDKVKSTEGKATPKPRTAPNPLSMLGAGVELAGAVGLMALGGWWLDGYLDMSPVFLLTGLFVGLIGGLYNLWKQAQRFF